MKCRKCDEKAVINMRQHRLSLCKTHFLEWIPDQVERFIGKYKMFNREDRVLVAVSGGKDSLSLWDILVHLGYQAEGLYIGLGIDEDTGYSDQSQQLSEQFAAQRKLKLHIVNVAEDYGETIPEMANRTKRGKGKPCSVCGLTKRHIMNRAALEYGYDVLVTGHNLDDEAAVLFGNTLNWLSDHLVRQGPVLEAVPPGLIRKAKPLCRLYEKEIAAYAFLSGIEYIYDECPFAEGSKSIYYKEILNKLEADRPGTKLVFYISYLQAKQEGLFEAQRKDQKTQIHTCPSCGQPTTVPGKCTFCRLVEYSQEK
jgi:uncharacterized protein (TIGR00269 family)